MRPIDLIVVGSVAVNDRGARLGKGAGYADLEVGLLAEAGLLGGQTVIATTVHELQVLDEELPELDHDFRVDVIVTPERVIWCGHPEATKAGSTGAPCVLIRLQPSPYWRDGRSLARC